MRQSAVSFQTEGLSFEGVMAQPDDGSGPWPGVVICHPHPLHGGSMDNNVVLALALGLVEEGFVTLRFNFRGVGGSEGEHTEGEKESQEVLGALDLIKAWPPRRAPPDDCRGPLGRGRAVGVPGTLYHSHRAIPVSDAPLPGPRP